MRPASAALPATLALAALVAGAIAASPAPTPAPAATMSPAPADLDAVIRANNRGAALMEQFKHAAAAAEYAKVVAGAPRWAPGFVNLGLASLYAQDAAGADAAFRTAARLDPGLAQAHYGTALVLKNAGDNDGAIAALEKARALDPEDADILYNLGLLHARERRFREAVQSLSRARQIDPNSMAVRYQLARALLQSGRGAEGEKEMEAYKKLSANPRFAVPTGTQYGEAGRYARVITDATGLGGPPAPAPAEAVRFSDATSGSGVAFDYGGPGGEPRLAPAAGEDRRVWAARFGPGVAVVDLDRDDRPDLVFAGGRGKTGGPAVYRNKGGFAFEDVTAASGLAPRGLGTGVAAADYDNDLDVDLFFTGPDGTTLYRNDAGAFEDATAAARAAVNGFTLGAVWADVDHDGDLDLHVSRAGAAPVVLLNRGDGTFRDATAALKMGAPAAGAGAVFADFDNDRDIDAAVSGRGAPDVLLENRRDAGFADRGAAAALSRRGAGRGVSAGDVDGDGLSDLVFAGGAGAPHRILLNGPSRVFAPRDLPLPASASTWGSALFDADNDGDLDLFFTGDANRLLLNDGRAAFRDASAESGLAGIPVRDGRAAVAADLDGDGDLDLVVTRNGGVPLLLRNEGGHRNRWLRVDPRGLNSNRDGIGTKVEAQAGSLWQRREIQGGGGYLSQAPPWAHFGLRDRAMADFVRLLWPGGVLQAELDVPAGQRSEQAELDRKGSSCPLLFAWTGARYGFVTDFLGVGGLGMWLAPGVYGKPDPDEYVKIEPDQLAPRDGAYYLQIMENLEETTYLDETTLLAVDHARNVDIYPNEAFGAASPPPFRIFAVPRADRVLPVRASDNNGRDVSAALQEIDRRYPDDFRLHRLAGYAEMHHVTLEFPESVTRLERPVLFLYGWVDFEYASSNFAAHQAGLEHTPPVLEMENADGVYAPVIDTIGYPGGMPRMMTVDLAPIAPLKTRRIRLRTNLRVFYDQIFIAQPLSEEALGEAIKVSEIPIGGAHLHRRGFPRQHSPDGREPKVYDYAIIDNTQPFKLMKGDYTRFGRVTDLLRRSDDQFVIFGRGEEITLEFPVKGLPQVPRGRTRSFLLRATGFCKDMDPHTAFGETVEPLPFRAMSAYPYPDSEAYPSDPEHREYRAAYNTRRVDGH